MALTSPPRLSDALRQRHDSLWERLFSHHFVRGIGDGSLEPRRFRFYLGQDYLYLVEYGRALALAVAKAPDLATMGRLSRVLEATLNEEMELHRRYSAGFGVSAADLEASVEAPATHTYTRFLLAVAYSSPLSAILYAILPCAWGYYEIARRLRDAGGIREGNRYAEWIRTYTSDEYATLAEWLRTLADGLADGLPEREAAALERLYVDGLRHELAFWDMAYSEGSA